MTAWVLIIALGVTGSTSVPGIESEQECRALAARLAKEWVAFAPPMQCFSYRGDLPTSPPPVVCGSLPSGESDPAVTPDYAGGETISSPNIARAALAPEKNNDT